MSSRHIDPSLAKGYVKQIFTQIGAANNVRLPLLAVGTIRQRKRSCKAVINAYKPILVDAVAGREYSTLATLTLRTGSTPEGKDLIISHRECIHFGDRLASNTFSDLVEVENGSISAIGFHAVLRCVQRASVRNIADLIEVVGSASNWTAIANATQHHGPFMVPAEKGMICCDTVLDGRHLSRKGSLIKTFIGLDDMTDRTKGCWERLVAEGALTNVPRAVKSTVQLEKYRGVFNLLAEEGARWKSRSDSNKGACE